MSDRSFGRYSIKGEIGRGGMATVYLGYDPRADREVALKVLPPEMAHDPTFFQRFQREARTVAALEHSAIVPLYDFGEEGGWPFFVMRLMRGGSLQERMAAGPLPPEQVLPILQRIAAALDHAHSMGIVHRDLKPQNILFDDSNQAYLSDFGIVKLTQDTATITAPGQVVGTPAYMSPEQVHGDRQLDGRSDIYTLGLIVYELLAGSRPFAAQTASKQMMAHVLDPVPDILAARRELPAALGPVISKALAKEPANRYATAGELAQATAAALYPQGTAAWTAAPGPQAAAAAAPAGKSGRPRWLIPALLAAAALVVVAVVAISLALLGGGADEATPSPEVAAGVEGDSVADPATEAATEAASPTVTAVAESADPESPSESDTATPRPSATVLASPTIALVGPGAGEILLEPSAASVNVRRGPGTVFGSFAALFEEETAVVLARSEDGFWYLIELPDGRAGWVSDAVVTLLDGATMDDVAVAATEPAPPTATFTPTPTPTPTPTATSTFTPTPAPLPTNTPEPAGSTVPPTPTQPGP
ncbi:MAG: serine/threonine protein kinase [Candidatus Promineifilaceae bacterium]|nr:serine/threonine protein kinase [Candidatus Promineifilaceae bacterium]